MKDFKNYYTDEKIIRYLCKVRIKYAKRRRKKNLLNKLTYKKFYLNEISNEYDLRIIAQLDKLLPKRRLWLTGGQRSIKVTINPTTGKSETQKIDTDKKNIEILYNTIIKYRKAKSDQPFITNLNEFIKDIQDSINNNTYRINSNEWDLVPEIKETNRSKRRLELKKEGANECRPISRFGLKDRIVLSLTNRFLTELFDDFFEEDALAFRAKKDDEINRKNHHTAIRRIIENKQKYPKENLYVAECDMKKFYDTVNHKKCLKAFYQLVGKATLKFPDIDSSNAVNIFEEYLNFYSFNCNVEPKNQDIGYWNQQFDKKGSKVIGKFPWVKNELSSSEYYKNNPDDRIGVPQGGALSGLIANIILDQADKKLKKIEELFYVRYCDDMILMHVNQQECQKAIEIYKSELDYQLLFSHDFKNSFIETNKSYFDKKNENPRTFQIANSRQLNRCYQYSIKSFWTCKSKGPYRWGPINMEKQIFPWIAFVGYEVNYKCEVRVRKKSLKKELEKQKRVVSSIIRIIKKGKNARNGSIYRSGAEKLNGMSVGRINLYDYKTCKNENSWTHGFQCLNLNRHSKAQLKTLDRNKYHFLRTLEIHLGEDIEPDNKVDSNGEILKYHKPFSYYYQAGEKRNPSIS